MQSGNYVIENDVVATDGSIERKTVKLEWRGSTGLVYNGTSANVNVTAHELIPGDECEVEVGGGKETNAGENYPVKATGLSNKNYVLPDYDTTSLTYSIAKASPYVPEKSFPYNGKAEFTAEGVDSVVTEDSNEKVDIKLTASSPEAGNYIYSVDIAAESTYTYSARTDNANYRINGGAMPVIEKIDPTIQRLFQIN